ncbi:MAG: TetR family transcriptional regulator [Pseudomonadota bacterium]
MEHRRKSAPAAARPDRAPAPRRKLRDADATRDAILRVATEEVAAKGLHGSRVEEIAARTATSKNMIYYYFGSKEGLYAAVLERAYADFRSAEGGFDYDRLEPLEAIAALAGATFDAHVGNPHVVRILMTENLDLGRHGDRIDHSAQRRLVLDTTGRILARGVAAGVVRADAADPLQFHLTISSLSFFFVGNRHTFGRLFDYDMADPANIAARRAEVIEIMLSRCRA